MHRSQLDVPNDHCICSLIPSSNALLFSGQWRARNGHHPTSPHMRGRSSLGILRILRRRGKTEFSTTMSILTSSIFQEHLWTSIQWQAAIVVYSINDKRSFSAAADALYQIRAQCRTMPMDGAFTGNLPIPIVLVANKIDLERQRQVQDLGESPMMQSSEFFLASS